MHIRGKPSESCFSHIQPVVANPEKLLNTVASIPLVCMVITYSKSKDQPGKVANPARSQLNRER